MEKIRDRKTDNNDLHPNVLLGGINMVFWPYGAQSTQRKVLEMFKKAGAVSLETKKTPEEAGINDTLATWIDPIVRRGELIKVEEDGKKYYYIPSEKGKEVV